MNNLKKIQTILIGSNNVNKVTEIKTILLKHQNHLTIMGISDYIKQPIPNVIEDGSTFEENAYIKANAYYQVTKKPIITDDSGLVVPALNGEPGIYSARYKDFIESSKSGVHHNTNDLKNTKLLLSRMNGLQNKQRLAYFKCVIVFYISKNFKKNIETFFIASGEIHGHIANEIRGENGFGYDPIFVPNDYQKTFGELGSEVKNQNSHRKIALDNLLKKINF